MSRSTPSQPVVIHTDGGCRGNPGPGAWAAILRFGDRVKALSGFAPSTTNNRMELQAAIEALRALQRPCPVLLHTDSRLLVNGATSWLAGWKKRGWRRSGNQPVANRDLWQELDEQLQRHQVQWIWVKGHGDDPGNLQADALVNQVLDRETGR